MIYLRNRYYDPATVQFVTRDPITAMTNDPYGYTGGNPVNATDPSGLVWRKYASWIQQVANYFQIDPVTLAAVIEREGGDRNTCGIFCGMAEYFDLAGNTIGIGQMRVDLANRLVAEHWDIHESEGTTRTRLALNNCDGIALAGAYLSDLQSKFGLSSREASIAYAFGEGQISELRRTNWQGPQATGLGRGYDNRYKSIAATGVFR